MKTIWTKFHVHSPKRLLIEFWKKNTISTTHSTAQKKEGESLRNESRRSLKEEEGEKVRPKRREICDEDTIVRVEH